MGRKLVKLVDIFFNRQFILFIVVGCINTLSTTVFASIYTSLFNDIQSFILGYLTGIVISYSLNAMITFKEALSAKKFIRFGISTIPNFSIQIVIVYIGVNILALPNIICYAMAAVIGVPITFLIVKVYVFVRK